MKIGKIIFLFLLLPALSPASDMKGSWVLDKSELDYQVTHPLHHVTGKSTQARGKGICSGTDCHFIVAVPVKSFDSGDSNRDLHMLQITRGADYPLIVVQVEFPTPAGKDFPQEILADLDIQFGGKIAKYPSVKLEMAPLEESGVRVTANIPIRLNDFKIEPPSLLGMPIDDLVPIQLNTTWKKVIASNR